MPRSLTARLECREFPRKYFSKEANVSVCADGRVERSLIKEGNLVGDGEATLLTTVIKYDPIQVYFNIIERALSLKG